MTKRIRTHWEDCWRDPTHYECAVARIEQLMAAKKPKVLLQYDVVDGEVRETHRWLIPSDTTADAIIEHIENSPTIDPKSVGLFGVTETEEF